jgi:CHAT domain-containing protein
MRKLIAAGWALIAASSLAQAQPPGPQQPPAAQAPVPQDEDLPPLEETPLPPVPEIQLPPLPPVEPVQPLTHDQYREGAFKAAQWAFRTDAAVALDRLAARFAAGGDSVGRLETELQALAQSLRGAERALSDSFQREGPAAEAYRQEMRGLSETLERQVRDKVAEIQRLYPRYSELVRPQAYDFEALRALLRPDEAVLLIVSAEDATYLFAISSERYQWYRTADLPQAQVDAAVARLRASLASSEPGAPFDRQLAHRLYRGLIAPANEIIGGKRVLMTISSGSLATLPLNVLVTETPRGADGDAGALAATQWLADRHVLTNLPAVSSLVALRCLLVSAAEHSPGCRQDLTADPAASVPRSGSLVLAAAGAPVLAGRATERRRGPGTIGQVFQRGPLADPDHIRNSYPPLDGALAELDALRERYGARGHVIIGPAATEQAVKEDEQFRAARFVVFATHGVFASREGGYGEPGLVFTPPASGRQTALDDGFLGASEVAELHFSADLVVLSACNTAASNGAPGGEGLSGLARAFFFAGARSLLVSHWEVDDTATSLLMTTAFQRIDASQGRGRGAAVQEAMRAVRTTPAFAHPRYWGAFTLVGDAS